MTQLKKQEGFTLMPKEAEVLGLIPLAMERVGSELDQRLMVNMAKDVISEFPHADTELIKSAMKKGALGHFGKTFKFTTQEVCIWIREEILYRRKYNPDGTQRVF